MDSLDSEMDDSGCIQDDSTISTHRDYAVDPDQYCLLDLPDNVLISILQYCEPRDLKALGFICPRLGSLIAHKSLWVEVREVSQPTSADRFMWYLRHVLHEGTTVISVTGYADIDGCQGECIPKTEDKGGNGSDNCQTDGVGKDNDDNTSQPSNSGARRPHVEVRQLPRITSTWEESDIKHAHTCSSPRASLSMSILQRLRTQCTALHTMEIDYCYIDCSKIDITNFPPTLRRLSMRGTKCFNNRIDHPFMFRISDALPKLEELDVSYCSWFEGSSFLTLSKLPHLRAMVAKDCKKLGEFIAYASVAARFGFKALQVIDMRGSPLATSEVSAFGLLPALRELYLSAEKRGKQREKSGSQEELYDWEIETPLHYQTVTEECEQETEEKQKKEERDTIVVDVCSNKRPETEETGPNKRPATEETGESGPNKRPRADTDAAGSSQSIDNIFIDNMSNLIHQRNLNKMRIRNERAGGSNTVQATLEVTAASSSRDENRVMSNQIETNSSKSDKSTGEPTNSCDNKAVTALKASEIAASSTSNGNERENSGNLLESCSKSDENQQGSSKSDSSALNSDNNVPTCSDAGQKSDNSDPSDEGPSSSNGSGEVKVSDTKSNSKSENDSEEARLARKRNADGELRNNDTNNENNNAHNGGPNRQERLPNVEIQARNDMNGDDGLNEDEIELNDAIRVVRVQGNAAGYQNGQNFIMGNRLERHQIVYVNIGERLNGMMQVSFRNNRAVFQRIVEPDDELYNTYNTQFGRLINPSTLITDDAIRNFGRSDNDVNYIHIGQNGIFVRRHENNSKLGKSKLKILVCTGYIGVTNSSLIHLSTSAPQLKFIDFRGTKVNDKGVEKFKSTRLECEVLFGENKLDIDYREISKGLIDELDG